MKQHILVVDDEPQVRQLFGLYLERQGYRVSTAATAKETLQMIAEQRIDLVVLDIGLADEDGLAVLAAIKRKHPNLWVVMLTGMGFVEDLLQEALLRGADGYVSKDRPLEELALTIHQVFNPHEAARTPCEAA